MTTRTSHTTNQLPHATRTRLQYLLDQGDALFFANNPLATERQRFYFKGEAITGEAKPSRYIIVSRDADSRLMRRFEQEVGGE